MLPRDTCNDDDILCNLLEVPKCAQVWEINMKLKMLNKNMVFSPNARRTDWHVASMWK